MQQGAGDPGRDRSRVENHPVLAYYLKSHPQKNPETVISVVRVHQQPFEKWAMEGHMIKLFQGKYIMTLGGIGGQNSFQIL